MAKDHWELCLDQIVICPLVQLEVVMASQALGLCSLGQGVSTLIDLMGLGAMRIDPDLGACLVHQVLALVAQ